MQDAAETDIVIAGAGVMGASIAFQLSRQTDKRVLFEENDLMYLAYGPGARA